MGSPLLPAALEARQPKPAERDQQTACDGDAIGQLLKKDDVDGGGEDH